MFYNRGARIAQLEREKAAASHKNNENINKETETLSNDLFSVSKNENDSTRMNSVDTDKQSNKILQNILQASKLFEGRFTYNELSIMDIPNFEALVDNEFANIDKSYKDFKEKGIVNAYTKNETMSSNSEVQFINEIGNSVRQ